VLTVRSQGTLNINPADKVALRVILRLGFGDSKLAEGAAEKVLALRKSDARGNLSSEKAFHNLQQLAATAGLPPNAVERITQMVPLNVYSNVFRISALGEVNHTQHLITAIVSRGYEMCQPDQLNPLFERGAINTRLRDAFRRRHQEARELIEQFTVRVEQWQEL
jgi:hypothetical protein